MKEHILTALREQFNRWEELLASLSDEQITAPNFDDDWSIKDVMNHLWGWQQISVARMNAAVLNREPEFPNWLTSFPGNWEENANETNAWIYKNFHNRSWAEANKNWREGFLRLLDLGEMILERNLLDGDRYPWLKGYSLAAILIASYDHHQEHLEKLLTWLQNNVTQNSQRPPKSTSDLPAISVNRSMPEAVIIPELAYRDVAEAVAWLCNTFGFKERLRIGSHRAQLSFDQGSIVVTQQRLDQEAGPVDLAHSIMVRVEDINRHYERVVRHGVWVIHHPADYPYGERQYTVEDLGGHIWTFSQTIADIDPMTWGGILPDQG